MQGSIELPFYHQCTRNPSNNCRRKVGTSLASGTGGLEQLGDVSRHEFVELLHTCP